MVFIDLTDVYLQVPLHPGRRRYLQFVAFGKVFQFKVVCFGLSTAPQVFMRVMAPVLAMLRNLGARILRCLDDWLILAPSRIEALWANDTVLDLCHPLGSLINYDESHLSPSQSSTYLWMVIKSQTLRAFPTSPERVLTLFSQLEEFLYHRRQSIITWRSLLGCLSSLCLLVPEDCLRMRSLQLVLWDLWNFLDSLERAESTVVIRCSESSRRRLAEIPTSRHVLVRRLQSGGTSLSRVSGQWKTETCPSI